MNYKNTNSAAIDRLVYYCNLHSISMSKDKLENIRFIKGNVSFGIHPNIFYRYSGICEMRKEIKTGFSDSFPIDDDMFYNVFIKKSINLVFKIENQ